MRIFLAVCCFAGFWTGSFLAAWIVLPVLALWPGTRTTKLQRGLRVTRFGFRVFHLSMRIIRMFHTTSPSRQLRPGTTPVVLVGNHPTLVDITAIVSMFPDTVTITRLGLAQNPLIRRAIDMCGFVAAGTHVLVDCEERLKMGFDVLVFPEGTRSPTDGPLHRFHRGAFELAIRANVPIVLLKLVCEPSILAKRQPIWKIADVTALLTIEPFHVIYPDQFGDSRALCREVEQRYGDLLYPAHSPAVAAASAVGDVQ